MLVRVRYLCFTISMLTPTMWPLLLRGISKVGLVLPAVSWCLLFCVQEVKPNNSSHLLYCITRCRRQALHSRLILVNGQLVYVSDTNVTKSCWQGHSLFSRSVSPCLVWCWSPVSIHLGSIGWLWLTYPGRKWCSYDIRCSIYLHLDCHYECTMWTFNQVSVKVPSIWYRVVFSVFLIALLRC